MKRHKKMWYNISINKKLNGYVAQRLERSPVKRRVAGSNPAVIAKIKFTRRTMVQYG